MTQYQSFPEAPGDSRTLDKLKALNLPDLRGRRFLDVGCNEGFFCGFAKHQGAVRAVGVDYSALFVERAKARFSECEFYRQDWSTLPEGEFDVILLASALHYADDQPALIRRLVDKLSPRGVLVLELGIVSQPDSDWVLIKRGIDERYFPTMLKLREVLSDYAWKWMGPSVSQAGDPVARHVVHIGHRLPVAYLLMQPPAFGKSSIAAHLFPAAGVPVVSGDQQLLQVSRDGLSVSPELKQAVTQDFSAFRVDECVRRVFNAGLGKELVALWSQQVPAGESFALDAYVPPEHHHIVKSALAEAGYLPVLLQWDRPGLHLLPADMAASRAEAFFKSLGAPIRSSTWWSWCRRWLSRLSRSRALGGS